MSRRPFIAGNWKMFKSRREARDTAEHLQELLGASLSVDVVICPP
ncbi:MAG: triose-phosphate isomerase, partial [Acidobacteria bacterium]|nr:triose-phosphate isomerase [Acidobacteriota bacterium]